MIYQLPNGRIIEISVEQFLDLDDTEVKELDGLSSVYSLECNNPFYNLFSSSLKDDKAIIEELSDDDDFEEYPFDFELFEEYNDDYFHPDDI